ncbi:restriction endonuclease subunit S [Parabacteroides sp. ASD2025]|uniref:restriction endonuclease subunit S n=1 Tax=Parabacteroides sp. ASD2025 TaxID=3415987 RepID=UPI003CEF17EC
MEKYKLGDITTVEISGVDKKMKDGEKEIRLCNFVDVYYNWAITAAQYDSFMLATARSNEISKFQLKKGQVALTKDSETRDDIGIPTYIADDFDDVILGYHCALITPNKDILDGRYLNALLQTDYAKKYFACNASGSGQRYALSIEALNSFPVPVIPLQEQKQIGETFSALDKKIELNRAINQNLEAMAKQLYDYWFVQFDFPNEEGKPYKSSGGEMVWNEKLKREIPKEWEVLNLGQITTSYQQGLIRSNNQLSDSSEFGYLKMGDLDGKGQYSLQKLARTNATSEEVFLFSLHKGDFLINVRNSKEIVGKTCLIDYVEENTLFNHMLVRMSFDKVTSFYMNLLFNTDFMYRAMDGLKQGTTTVIALYQEDLYRLPIVVPTKNVMDTFSIIEKSILNQKELLTNEIISLIKQRDELLPLLMNGQVSVNSDLSHG